VHDGDRRTLQERLRLAYPQASGRSRKAWLESGRVRVNGAVVRRGDVPVAPGDRIDLGRPSIEFPAQLRLVHDDEHLIVIDKPPGLLTIATERERGRTAYRLLRDWVERQEQGRIFVVHRLDRETSGLVVFARTPVVKRFLQTQFASRAPERVYVARVEGVVADDEGELSSRLIEDRSLRVHAIDERGDARRGGGETSRRGAVGERHAAGSERRDAAPDRRGRDARGARRGDRGQDAITRYRVLDRFRDATVLELRLVTGRRGQLRAQLAALGHPIAGDRAYGSRRDPLGRVCLHATRLGFAHPDRRRVVFESPPPPGFFRR
jgi:23S rRNA pseudouridine1911/1915/1917 synthase